MSRIVPIAIAFLILSSSSVAPAREKDEIPPANAKRLSEIIESVEAQGHTVITDVDFDDWKWIVRVYKAGLEFEILIDPVSGETLSVTPKT